MRTIFTQLAPAVSDAIHEEQPSFLDARLPQVYINDSQVSYWNEACKALLR
jgi:hypothetical protein